MNNQEENFLICEIVINFTMTYFAGTLWTTEFRSRRLFLQTSCH